MKKLFLFSLLFTSYLSAEPSAFSAGDLSADEPYGLTNNEKLLLKNIDTVKHLNRDKNVINSDVDQLKSDLEGLRSVMNGVALSQQKTKKLIKKILETQDDLEVSSLEHKNALSTVDSNITNLSLQLTKLVDLQNKNYEKIKNNFNTFDLRLKAFEENYVSKKTFDALQLELKNFRTLVTGEFKKLNKTPKKAQTKSGKTLYSEGRAALKAKKYKTAATRFMGSIAKKHRPASSHFYAGEAYYQQKRYKKAISYFKESYKLYKKGKYNAKLFLHMGISLHKLGQKAKAIKVFKTVIKKYPDTSYARAAKKYL